jgi:hypothetical protein
LKTEEYDSVKKWFEEGTYGHPFSPETRKVYKKYMDTFCRILNMTPDELAKLSPEQALEAQIKVATVMKEQIRLRELSITNRVCALHSFWRANDVVITEDIMEYKGTPWLWRKRRVE